MERRFLPSIKKIVFIASFFLVSFTNLSRAVDLPVMSQPKVRHVIAKGEKYFGELVLSNPSSETRSIRLYLEDWRYAPGADGAKEFFPAGSTQRSCAPWIKFTPQEFILPPQAQQKIHYTISVPDKDVEGGYYAVLFHETVFGQAEPAKEDRAAIDLTVRVGTIVYVEIKGATKREGIIDNLSVEREPYKNRLEIELDVKNTGNVDITAGGTFHVIDKKGVVYARSGFNKAYTFPGDTAKLKANWDIHNEPIPEGAYDMVVTVDIGKAQEEAGLGRGPIITKEAEIEFGYNGKVNR